MFTPDPDVLAAVSVLTLPLILNFFGAATRSVGFSLINGSGRSVLNLIVALVDGMIARIGFAWLLGFQLQMDCLGFWLGDAIAGFFPFLPKLFKKYNIREVTSSKSSQKMEKVEASETNLKETLALFVQV